MGHIVPHNRETDRPKTIGELTESERIHIADQIEDDFKNGRAIGRPVSDETVAFAHKVAVGTAKEGLVDLPNRPVGQPQKSKGI